ncbi:hypothetical protein FACS1894190_00280 [Spirochaetia bacterium]|nr:hypothetical protein FACS1894190_00280 [Spirochaetia bacterium]
MNNKLVVFFITIILSAVPIFAQDETSLDEVQTVIVDNDEVQTLITDDEVQQVIITDGEVQTVITDDDEVQTVITDDETQQVIITDGEVQTVIVDDDEVQTVITDDETQQVIITDGEVQTVITDDESQAGITFTEDEPVDTAESIEPDKIPYNLLRNDYFLESLRQKNYARLAIDEGEYDKSAWHSSEAERYAQLSDDYIKSRLARGRAQKALAAANAHIVWAKNEQAEKYYPKELAAALAHYEAALSASREEDWPLTIENALAVENDLNGVAAPPPFNKIPPGMPRLPTQYKVRPWDKFGDCLWNISNWFYGNPYRWTVLYEANREKLPEPDNPDLIEIGTVLDIPSLNGEKREGVWDSGRSYQAD